MTTATAPDLDPYTNGYLHGTAATLAAQQALRVMEKEEEKPPGTFVAGGMGLRQKTAPDTAESVGPVDACSPTLAPSARSASQVPARPRGDSTATAPEVKVNRRRWRQGTVSPSAVFEVPRVGEVPLDSLRVAEFRHRDHARMAVEAVNNDLAGYNTDDLVKRGRRQALNELLDWTYNTGSPGCSSTRTKIRTELSKLVHPSAW